MGREELVLILMRRACLSDLRRVLVALREEDGMYRLEQAMRGKDQCGPLFSKTWIVP